MAKGGGWGREEHLGIGRRCCGDIRVVLVFWIFCVIFVNFVCCYGFWVLL